MDKTQPHENDEGKTREVCPHAIEPLVLLQHAVFKANRRAGCLKIFSDLLDKQK